MRYAVVTFAGPGAAEAARSRQLVASLFRHEPSLPTLVMFDDTGVDARANVQDLVPASCNLIVLKNPVKPGYHRLGVNTTTMFRYLSRETDFDWIVQMDSDSLVIGPFVQWVSDLVAKNPKVGQIGFVDRRCNGEPADYDFYARMSWRFQHWFQFQRTPKLRIHQSFWGPRARIRKIARQVYGRGGVPNGLHCQGGAYAMTRHAIVEMDAHGLLDLGDVPQCFGGADDLMTSMFVLAAGVPLINKTAPGDPFGVEARGLAFSPQELVDKGYSLIHSVKNDKRFPEAEIIRFFETRDRAAAATSA